MDDDIIRNMLSGFSQTDAAMELLGVKSEEEMEKLRMLGFSLILEGGGSDMEIVKRIAECDEMTTIQKVFTAIKAGEFLVIANAVGDEVENFRSAMKEWKHNAGDSNAR